MFYDSISIFIAVINSALKFQSVCIWRKRRGLKLAVTAGAKKPLIYCPLLLLLFHLLLFISGQHKIQTISRTLKKWNKIQSLILNILPSKYASLNTHTVTVQKKLCYIGAATKLPRFHKSLSKEILQLGGFHPLPLLNHILPLVIYHLKCLVKKGIHLFIQGNKKTSRFC